jgi:hypothetical protein
MWSNTTFLKQSVVFDWWSHWMKRCHGELKSFCDCHHSNAETSKLRLGQANWLPNYKKNQLFLKRSTDLPHGINATLPNPITCWKVFIFISPCRNARSSQPSNISGHSYAKRLCTKTRLLTIGYCQPPVIHFVSHYLTTSSNELPQESVFYSFFRHSWLQLLVPSWDTKWSRRILYQLMLITPFLYYEAPGWDYWRPWKKKRRILTFTKRMDEIGQGWKKRYQ